MASNQVIRNLAEAVKHEIERLNTAADVQAYWEQHVNWLKLLAETLSAAAKERPE